MFYHLFYGLWNIKRFYVLFYIPQRVRDITIMFILNLANASESTCCKWLESCCCHCDLSVRVLLYIVPHVISDIKHSRYKNVHPRFNFIEHLFHFVKLCRKNQQCINNKEIIFFKLYFNFILVQHFKEEKKIPQIWWSCIIINIQIEWLVN